MGASGGGKRKTPAGKPPPAFVGLGLEAVYAGQELKRELPRFGSMLVNMVRT